MTEDVLTLVRRANPAVARELPGPESAAGRRLVDKITGRQRRRRLAIALVAAAVAGAVAVATPAVGVLRDLFGGEHVTFEQTPFAELAKKYEFAELSTGAPSKEMDPQVIPGETRLVATFTLSGHPRRLWVAPTKKGGFCFELEHSGGGCNNPPRPADPIDLGGSFTALPGTTVPIQEQVSGIIYDAEAAGVRLEFEDGRAIPLRFVYVSEPIDAGFFAYNPSHDERLVGHRPLRVLLLHADGSVSNQKEIDYKNEQRMIEEVQKQRPGGVTR